MSAPGWLDELAPAPGPPWHAMGTRGLDPAAWLLVDEHRGSQLAEKRTLLATAHDTVVAVEDDPRARAVAEEAAEVVAAASGRPLPRDGRPLEAAAAGVQEDLCVLVPGDDGWRLAGGVVCFPSMWRIGDKLGLPLASVHGPVPAYADELGPRVDRFLDRLRPERPVWRRNWFIHESPALHQPEPPPPAARLPEVPDGLWLRSERQTLRRLPRTDGILFTIATQQVPLAVLAERPDVAAGIATAVAAWSPELVRYRGAERWREAGLAWLSSVR